MNPLEQQLQTLDLIGADFRAAFDLAMENVHTLEDARKVDQLLSTVAHDLGNLRTITILRVATMDGTTNILNTLGGS